jgi:SH3-like domain-containing protein
MNFTEMKILRKSLTVLLLISGCFIFSSCDRSTYVSIEPTKATIANAGKVYSNFAMDLNNANNKIYSEVVSKAKSGQRVLIMESGRWDDFKIQMPDGSMGWIEGEYLKPSKNTFIKYQSSGNNRHIASNRGAIGSDRKIVKEVNEKTAVTRLEEYREVKRVRGRENILNWTKVRTEDGTEGWIMSDYLYKVVIDSNRFINRKEWRYGMDYFVEEWKGKSIEKFIEKFKEPSGIKITEKQSIYYFNNIFLFNRNNESYGVRVYVKDSLIETIDAGAHKTSWVSYLPLSSALRINLVGNYIGNWNYMFEDTGDPNGIHIDIRDYMPEWLSFIVILLVFLIGLGILYFILKIPFIIVNKVTYKQSLNRKLFNRRIMLYAILGSIILGYLFSLIMLVNVYPFNDYFFITAIFCLGMILRNISKWRNDLGYNRCNAATCHQWTGEHSWTEYLGGEKVTQTMRDGSTNTQTTRRYREHRICSACSHEWSILRTHVIGGLKY